MFSDSFRVLENLNLVNQRCYFPSRSFAFLCFSLFALFLVRLSSQALLILIHDHTMRYFMGKNFYLDILQIQENWASRNLITNSRVYSLLIAQAKTQTEINNNKRMVAFRPLGTAQIIRIFSYPIRKKSRFWLFCMWSVKGLYHALLPKTDYRDKGRGRDRKLKLKSLWDHNFSGCVLLMC